MRAVPPPMSAALRPPPPPIRACVFASASPDTPEKYMLAAAALGRALATANAVCVNGGGKFGCMGALNEALKAAGGRVCGVIHEKWVDGEAAEGLDEMLVASGDDLSERKRLLLDGASCLIALPGGVGTLDELLHTVAGVHTRIAAPLPICVVNTDGYYDGLILQLQRAEDEGLLRMRYTQLLHVEDTPEAAVAWCVGASAPVPPRERQRGRELWRRLALGAVLTGAACALSHVRSGRLGRA